MIFMLHTHLSWWNPCHLVGKFAVICAYDGGDTPVRQAIWRVEIKLVRSEHVVKTWGGRHLNFLSGTKKTHTHKHTQNKKNDKHSKKQHEEENGKAERCALDILIFFKHARGVVSGQTLHELFTTVLRLPVPFFLSHLCVVLLLFLLGHTVTYSSYNPPPILLLYEWCFIQPRK